MVRRLLFPRRSPSKANMAPVAVLLTSPSGRSRDYTSPQRSLKGLWELTL
jgi:hypothetical protein